MGYNDGGKNRTDRLKRHKREQERLAQKASTTTAPTTKKTATETPGAGDAAAK